MLWNTILLALREIRRNVLRSFLTILGIVIGVAAVITMVTIGGGATVQVSQQIASLGSNLLMVPPGNGLGPGQASRQRPFKGAMRRPSPGGQLDCRRGAGLLRKRQGDLRQPELVDHGDGHRQPVFPGDELDPSRRAGTSTTANCAPARRSASSATPCARSCSAARTPWGKDSPGKALVRGDRHAGGQGPEQHGRRTRTISW